MVLKNSRFIITIVLIILGLIFILWRNSKNTIELAKVKIEAENKEALNPHGPIKINSNECQKIKITFSKLTTEIKNTSLLSFENIHIDNHGIIYRLRKFHKNGIQKYYQYNVYREDANEEATLIEKSIGKEGTLYQKILKENYPIIFNEAGYNNQSLFLFYQNGKIKLAEGMFENQNIRCDLF